MTILQNFLRAGINLYVATGENSDYCLNFVKENSQFFESKEVTSVSDYNEYTIMTFLKNLH